MPEGVSHGEPRPGARFRRGTLRYHKRYSPTRQVSPADPGLAVSWVEFASPKGHGKARAYLARPAGMPGKGKLPVVLAIHENRGLNPHIEDIARRLALAGFIALAPDALFPLGGYPGDEDAARETFKRLDQSKTREDFVAAAGQARGLPGGNGKLGVVGFCYGGGMANYLATRLPGLDGAVSPEGVKIKRASSKKPPLPKEAPSHSDPAPRDRL